MLDSSIPSRNDRKLRKKPLTTAGVGTQPRRTRAQGRHSVRLRHQRAAFSAGSSLPKAQLISDVIL